MITLYGVKAKRLIDALDIPCGECVSRTVEFFHQSVEGRSVLTIQFKESLEWV